MPESRVGYSWWASLVVLSAYAGSGCTGTFEGPMGPAECGRQVCTADPPSGAVDSEADPFGGDDGNTPRGVGDPASPDGVGWSTRFPKLSNRQWENSVTDLLRLSQPSGLSEQLVAEPKDVAYASMAASLTVGGDGWARYQTAAETLAERAVTDEALFSAIVPASLPSGSDRARAFIAYWGRRAYRRPLTNVELSSYEQLFQQGPSLVGGDAFRAGVRLVLEATLQSPHFLYRVESTPGGGSQKTWLSGYEMAVRLSYALWNTTPSDALLDAAEGGELDSEAGVRAWAERMLEDPRAEQTLLSFHEQTFGVANYGQQDKSPELGFAAAELAPVLREEAVRFIREVVIEGEGGISDLLTAPLAYVNEDTAPFYGLANITGQSLKRVELDPRERAGLLTQLGFLATQASLSGSDPVHRGLTVLRKVLCDEPSPPPMMFSLPVVGAGRTTREVYEEATVCGGSCHQTLINPPGFAFENFDGVGRFRTTEVGLPVDATAEIAIRQGYTESQKAAGTTQLLAVNGAADMLNQLADVPRVHECYARNWLSFALAREVDPVEQGAFEKLAKTSQDAGSVRQLLIDLVALDTFRSRIGEPE